jgi:ribonucrease Y
VLLLEGLVLGIVICGAAFWLLETVRRRTRAATGEAAQSEAERILEETRNKSELLKKEAELKAKDLIVGARSETERELRERRRELTTLESKLGSREEALDKRLEAFERRESELNRRDQNLRNREKAIADKEAEHQALIDEARNRLEAVAGLTREEAKRTLLDEMIGQARHDASRHIRIVEEEAREEADRRAKRIISIAIERLAGEFVAERTVSVLTLPNDEMKGRIIGREGRNIRAIEAATGVDIIIDDTPEAVVISTRFGAKSLVSGWSD